ncbi:MAG: hypothetical protein ABFS02_04425 [Pseudomonadota bacterium]
MTTARQIPLLGAAEFFIGPDATDILNRHIDVLSDLIARQVRETYEPSPFWLARPRANLRRRIEGALDKNPPLVGSETFQRLSGNMLHLLGPRIWFFAWTAREEFEWSWTDTQRMLMQNRLALTLIGKRIAAIAGYKLGGKLADNRDVFELTKFVTHPDFRGHGLYRALRSLVIEDIQKNHPGSPMISFTKNLTVIRQSETAGWKALSLEEYSDITKRIGRSGISPEITQSLRHWKGFISDPQSGEQSR